MSLIERDWVMRMVKQIVDFIARALKLAKEGKDKEAIELLESGCLEVLGIPWSALALVDSKSAAGVLGDGARVAAFGRILEERATIEAMQGKVALAAQRREHALEIYQEALARSPKNAEALAGVARLNGSTQTPAE
ncbi:MAG: hypothetical protein QM723_13755 [Myxococcaceae bacterium]